MYLWLVPDAFNVISSYFLLILVLPTKVWHNLSYVCMLPLFCYFHNFPFSPVPSRGLDIRVPDWERGEEDPESGEQGGRINKGGRREACRLRKKSTKERRWEIFLPLEGSRHWGNVIQECAQVKRSRKIMPTCHFLLLLQKLPGKLLYKHRHIYKM